LCSDVRHKTFRSLAHFTYACSIACCTFTRSASSSLTFLTFLGLCRATSPSLASTRMFASKMSLLSLWDLSIILDFDFHLVRENEKEPFISFSSFFRTVDDYAAAYKSGKVTPVDVAKRVIAAVKKVMFSFSTWLKLKLKTHHSRREP
jgi:hypothetical protein